MAGPIDIGNEPPDPHDRPKTPQTPAPSSLRGQLPSTRASDMFKQPATFNASSGADVGKDDADRRATPFDDAASGLFTVCALLFCAGLVYLLWGMWSGAFAGPNWTSTFGHSDRLRVDGNIQICGEVMWGTIVIGAALFLFLFYHEDYAGYCLLATAIVMQVGIPYVTTLIYNSRSFAPTEATTGIFQLLSNQSWVAGVPGIMFVGYNIIVGLANGLVNAKKRRSGLKFGQQAIKDVKPRDVFLGSCWNMPYCKDSIRSKCPIFLAKRGPCWRNKRGCMCDQTIVLIATSPNWKQSVSSAVSSMERKSSNLSMPELPPQPHLSKEAKIERCRQCVIFNVHQEQKYKLLVGIVLAASAAFIFVYSGQLLSTTGNIFMQANSIAGRFSISTNTAPLFPNGAPLFVEWLMLLSVLLVVIAKLLQLVEYCCFRLKI